MDSRLAHDAVASLQYRQLSVGTTLALSLLAILGTLLGKGIRAEENDSPTSHPWIADETFLRGPVADNFLPLLGTQRNRQTGSIEQVQFLGPLFEARIDEDLSYKTVRPLFIHYWNDTDPLWRLHIAPPIFNYFREGDAQRWDIYQLIRYRHIDFPQSNIHPVTNFSVFPFFFYHETGHQESSYWGLFPVYGELQNFVGIRRINWALFPLYSRFDRGAEEVRYGVPWPVIRWQTGPISSGYAFWPLFGTFEREGAYHRQFALWPLYYRNVTHPDSDKEDLRTGFLPFYALEKGPGIKDESFLFPFFGYRHESDPNPEYQETRYFWPFFMQGSGEDNARVINRWAPFYTYSRHGSREKWWYMWPFIKHRQHQERGLLVDQQQFLYFLIWRNRQTSLENPDLPAGTMTHVWPFVSHRDNGAGHVQMQLFSPLEVFFPHNQTIRDLYSPLFAIYRYNQTPDGQTERSYLWNLITTRHTDEASEVTLGPLAAWESTPEKTSFTLLHGLFRRQTCEEEGTSLQLFWIDL